MPSLFQPDERLAFLRGFLRRPTEVGSVIPSSRFLERLIVREAALPSAKVAVELGPGTGGTTRALLRALPADATLLCIEVNPKFVEVLRTTIDDPRLVVHQGSAEDLAEIVAEHGLDAPDVVISGIPFSTMPPALGQRIQESIREALAPRGRFVAYQVRDTVAQIGRRVFGRPKVEAEFRNIPPMRVYRWERSA